MLSDLFININDHDLLASTAHQVKQKYHAEAESIRALETVARRRRKVGDIVAAGRLEELAERARAAAPWLGLADELTVAAHEFKRSPASS